EKLYVQVAGSVARGFRRAAGNDSKANAAALQQADAVAVADVEALKLIAAAVNDDAAVGQNPVQIEQQQLDFPRTVPDRGGDSRHGAKCPLSAGRGGGRRRQAFSRSARRAT